MFFGQKIRARAPFGKSERESKRMARLKKKVTDQQLDPFAFGSDAENDDEDNLSANRKRRKSGNSTPHSLRGSDAGGLSPCSDADGARSNCRARLSFSEGENGDTAASGPGREEWRGRCRAERAGKHG
jgi:hypothetical protein